MMSSKHQKKRNTGLMYEFLVRTISRALVEGDTKRSAAALKIVRRFFKPGTELYREFRLSNSLVRSTVSSPSVASSILTEAKAAARSYDVSKLDREKSLLIRSVNYDLKDDGFYDQHVDEYKAYATVQTLFNEWRRASNDVDIGTIAKYEDQLTQWLVTEKVQRAPEEVPSETAGTTRLAMKIMTKKLNEKYAGVLNDRQRALVKAYAFSSVHGDDEPVRQRLAETKDALLAAIGRYEAGNADNEFTLKKIREAKEQLLAEDVSKVDDDMMTRFMLYTKLGDELASED